MRFVLVAAIPIGQCDGLLRESPLFIVEDLHHAVGMHPDVSLLGLRVEGIVVDQIDETRRPSPSRFYNLG